jgi:hypothetical protein
MGYGGGSVTPKAKPLNFFTFRFALEGGRNIPMGHVRPRGPIWGWPATPHVAQKSHPKNYYYYYYYYFFLKKP